MLKKIGLILLIVFIIIQLIKVEQVFEEPDKAQDFLAITKANKEVEQLIVNSCYDCHSNQTKYPWYSNIAPVSWYVNNHIEEAKHHLNFSKWNSYSLKKANHKLEECYEELERHKMPTSDYVFMHSNAELTEEQITILANWFKNQMR